MHNFHGTVSEYSFVDLCVFNLCSCLFVSVYGGGRSYFSDVLGVCCFFYTMSVSDAITRLCLLVFSVYV